MFKPEPDLLYQSSIPDLDKSNESSFLNRWVCLIRAVGHEAAVDISILDVGEEFLKILKTGLRRWMLKAPPLNSSHLHSIKM